MKRLIGILLLAATLLAACVAGAPGAEENEGSGAFVMTPRPAAKPDRPEDLTPQEISPVAAPGQPASPTAESVTPAPPSLDDRVEQLLASMSPEEKVGQLFLAFFEGAEMTPALRELIVDCHVGGIVLFGITGNIQNPTQVARLTNALQSTATSQGAAIPLFIAIDQEGGPVVRLTAGATVFPSNMAVGATGSPDLARQMARVTAEELKVLGINMNLAPVLDVNSNPDNPVIGVRSFGSSPEQVAELGTAMLQAYQEVGILATVKHFPGHGDTAVDSHVGMPVVDKDLDRLERVELPPFKAAIAAGVDAIMTAHVLFPAVAQDGRPATLSAAVLQGLLREHMGFDGIIVSDALFMGALSRWSGTAGVAELAVQAGIDLLAFGPDPHHAPAEQKQAYDHLLDLVRAGAISTERLDDSVRRILAVKAKYGVLDWSPVDVDAVPARVGSPEHLAATQEIALASVTLLRDDAGALPIAPSEAVLVLWPARAGDLGGALAAYHAHLDIMPLDAEPTEVEIAEALRRADAASTVVVGTMNARRFPGQQELVRALLPYTPVVIALGDPNDLLAFPEAQTYLATYGSVPASLDAVAQILFGLAEPRGRLPVEVPGQFERGTGLTKFTTD